MFCNVNSGIIGFEAFDCHVEIQLTSEDTFLSHTVRACSCDSSFSFTEESQDPPFKRILHENISLVS